MNNIGKAIGTVGVWGGIALLMWVASQSGYSVTGSMLVGSFCAGSICTFFIW
jgi:hypothetical protein